MPRPGGACSSYLLQTHHAAVLFDVGPGAAGKLQLAIDYARLDAIVISHMHADHFLDLVSLRYGLKYGPRLRQSELPLWLPPGGTPDLDALGVLVGRDSASDFFAESYAVREYDPAQELTVKDLTLSFRRTRHSIDAFAIRAECNGASMVYSADTAPFDAVVEFARGCSLFLCEASLGLGTEEGERGHSSAPEAAKMANDAGAGRLLLTHYPASYSATDLIRESTSFFGDPIAAAEDGLKIDISALSP
jgi:ribonuclease BN (tRNA processing enzyme)